MFIFTGTSFYAFTGLQNTYWLVELWNAWAEPLEFWCKHGWVWREDVQEAEIRNQRVLFQQVSWIHYRFFAEYASSTKGENVIAQLVQQLLALLRWLMSDSSEFIQPAWLKSADGWDTLIPLRKRLRIIFPTSWWWEDKSSHLVHCAS